MSTVDIRPERRAELANGESGQAAGAGAEGAADAGQSGGSVEPGQPAGQADRGSSLGSAEMSDEDLLGRLDPHLIALEGGEPPQVSTRGQRRQRGGQRKLDAGGRKSTESQN